MAASGRVVIKKKTVRRPISGKEIGFRLQAAIPNGSGGRFDKPDSTGSRVSFHPKFLVAESSDFVETLSDRTLDKFMEELRFQGFNNFEMV